MYLFFSSRGSRSLAALGGPSPRGRRTAASRGPPTCTTHPGLNKKIVKVWDVVLLLVVSPPLLPSERAFLEAMKSVEIPIDEV